MKVTLRYGLPYVKASLSFRRHQLTLENNLLDTGSAGTIFSADKVGAAGIRMEPEDSIHRIRGVGGAEFVFTKQLDILSIGELHVKDFEIEVGEIDYGFPMDGILGMDFLTQVGAAIDLSRLEISQSS